MSLQSRVCRGKFINISQNSGIDMLVLGKAHVYLNSHFNYYQYNLTSSIILEHIKIISHKTKLIKYNNGNILCEGVKNILEFNCVRLQDKIKIINAHRIKRGIINGLGTFIKTITGTLDSNDDQKYRNLFEK